MQALDLNTGFGVVSHAHPPPACASPQALEEQRVRALITRQSINVVLRGLSCGRAATVADILTPKIRRSPLNEKIAASHMDLTECWKGLSHLQATELTMWYQFLHKCLREEVRANLCESLVKGLLQSEEPVDEIYLVARILGYFRSTSHRVINIPFVDLIDSIMGMFHDRFSNEAASVAPNWSHFSGGLSLFLDNFLRMQDCFSDLSNSPHLVIDFDFDYADATLTATGDVAWQLPNIRFFSLAASRLPGEEYRITPFISKEFHGPVSFPGCSDYVDQVNYTLTQSSLSFGWNPVKQCFRTVIPDYGDEESHAVETVLKATIVTPFPDHVQFERQSRWSIKLNVVPTRSVYGPSTRRSNEHVKRVGCDEDTPGLEQHLSSYRWFTHEDLRHSEDKAVFRNVCGNKTETPSPQKRKVSRPEVAGPVLETKRRCHHPAWGQESELAATLETDDEEKRARLFDQASWWQADETYADDVCSNTLPSGVFKGHVYAQRGPPHNWQHQHERQNSPSLLTDICHVNSNDTARSQAVERDYGALLQEQILRNYREFESLKSQRNDEPISPVSDGERRVFEDIFLEDSEEWSPATDGSGLDLDTVVNEI